ncbi:DASH complex subunit DAD1 [Candida viswanathii]|uniref:DASH complex subunit DAD1 n=1 Tax=Candida viswanathii TaxID=5486 RepID=A0A367YC63_9ASCO|nr:DASH complex subunit DAD1 [Candida viswanathii]
MAATSDMSTPKNEYFIKQRDLLIQEISNNLTKVHTNLEALNRSLHESKQIGKEFDDVARLWSTFYDGMNQVREKTADDLPKATTSEDKDTLEESQD